MPEAVVSTVVERQAGSELGADVSAGASTLTLVDPDEFDADGGNLTIGTEVFSYFLDADTGVATLKTVLVNAYDEGEPVYVYPPFTERLAMVREAGSGEDLEARVPHGLYDKLATGTRDETNQELVECELRGTELVVADVIGLEPSVDSSYLNTQHAEAAVDLAGVDPLTNSYQPIGGAQLTVVPERSTLYLVSWTCVLEFYTSGFTINGNGFASLLVNGVQTGIEAQPVVAGKWDNSGPNPVVGFPCSGQVAVACEPDIEYVFEIGVKKSGSVDIKVPLAKAGGISYVVFGS